MIRVRVDDQNRLLRVTLAESRACRLDSSTLLALAGLLGEGVDQDVRAVILDHDGPDLEVGTSVDEFLGDAPEMVLQAFGQALRAVVHCPVPLLAAVRGRCLGRGAALAVGAQFLFAQEDALLGFHETAVGLIAPGASALLPWRPALLRRMVLTGEIFDVHQLELAGLVTAATQHDPAAAALQFYLEHLAPRSPHALRHAVAAADPGPEFDRRLADGLARVERMLEESPDPVEGVSAFLEARAPRWAERR
jgi:enoyl-CoA hydratase